MTDPDSGLPPLIDFDAGQQMFTDAGTDAGTPDGSVIMEDAGVCLSCAGCCDSNGVCQPGTSATACGLAGATCVGCGNDPCTSGMCTMAVVGGDTCAAPALLTFDALNRAQASIDFSNVGDDTTASCGVSGKDAVVAFDITSANAYVTIDVTGPSGSMPSVSLRSACTDVNAQVACAANGRIAQRLATGRWYAWIEGGASAGPFTVTVTRTPVTTGDSCTQPRAITLNGGAASATGTLDSFGPDALSCSGMGRDAVYSFTLAAASTVTVRLTPNAASTFDPTLSLDSVCGMTPPSCSTGGPGAVETIQSVLGAGTWFVAVGSADGSSGTYSLSINAVATPVSDAGTCANPYTLTFNGSGQASAAVRTSGRANSLETSCLTGVSSGPDSVYEFQVNAVSDLNASLSGSVVGLALRNTCSGADLACSSRINVADLQPGTYYLVADAYRNETSTLTLNATLTPPRPPGETCARPTPLALTATADGGTAQVTGTLVGVTDDIPNGFNSDCTGITNAPDLVYALTTTRPLIVTASATRTSGTGAIEVAMVNDVSCAGGYATECNAAATTASVRALLPAGAQLIRVQGSVGIGFTLNITAVDPPEGESCDNMVMRSLPAGGGTATHTATTRNSTQQNFNNACVGYDMPDRVYAVTLPDPRTNLSITTTAIGSTNAPAFIVGTACNQIVPIAQRCGTTAAATKNLQIPALAAGTYYVWVKGPVLAGTDYRIDFTSTPTPPGEVCSVAIPITTSMGVAGGTASLTGTTVGASDDLYACNQISPAFPDKVYSVTTDRPLDLRVTMTADSGVGMLTLLDPMDCSTTSVCGTSGSTPGPNRLKTSLPVGTSYFSVDHTGGMAGAFTLDVELAPARQGDSCTNPLPLVFPMGADGGTVRLNTDLRDWVDATTQDCNGRAGDAYYFFDTTQPLDLRVVQVGAGSPVVGLGTSCTDLACGFGGNLSAGSIPPGRHLLVVDADYQNREAPFSFDVSLTPPTPGDTCAIALPLGIPGTGGTVTVNGSTANAFSEFSGTCSTSYPDRVYTFTTTRTLSLVAKASTATNAGSHWLSLRSVCNPATVASACGTGNRDASFLRATDLPAGTYFITVDKAALSSPDDFALEVTLSDRPAGDTCSTATPLAISSTMPSQVTVQGDTRSFFNDVIPSCSASTTPRDAADRVYSFTIAQPMNVRLFSHATTTGFRPTIALKRGCATTDTDQVCGWTPTFSADTWASWENLAAGTWFVVVDGYDSLQSGAFELTVRTSPANPAGDSCTAPLPVTLSAGNTGRATVTGSYADYFEDHTDCWGSTGADVVYSVTTNATRRLHVRATPSVTTAQPTLSVRTSPCAQSTSQVACERSSFDGTGRVSATINSGTSYVIMKSPLAYPQGTFSLEFQVDDFAPGDVCSGAIPLNLSTGTTTVTGDAYTFGAEATMSCDSNRAPDTYYTFTTAAPGTFTATLTRQDTSASFAMALYPGCAGAERACRSSGFSSQPVVLMQSALPAGTWTLVVRGGTTVPSGYSLTATFGP